MTIGSELKAAREQHALTLGDISSRTKIRVPVLRAIENDDFAHAPGGVIMRGFLKLYAREVGLDADDIARRFVAIQAAVAAAGGPPAGQLGLGRPEPSGPADPDASSSRWRAGMAAAVIVAILGGYVMWSRMSRPAPSAESVSAQSQPAPPVSGQPEPPPSAPAAATPAAPAAAPGSTSTAAATSGGTAPAAADVLRVDIRASDASWLAATADGQQIAYRMLNPGDHVSLSIKSVAVLRIGIPPNVAVSINDVPVKPFGTPGQPATLRITPDNYRTLLP
jgi:cytoskeletal protein RodZ